MASAIDQIININISQQTSSVPQAGFGIPLIMGPSDRFTDLIRYYSSPSDMLTDGFLTSDQEYIKAISAVSQGLVPTQFGIGKYTAPVAQVDTVTVNTIADTTVYSLTLNSILVSITSGSGATANSILTALSAAIVTANLGITPNVVTSTMTLTSAVAGVGFSDVGTTNLTVAHTTANHSIASDIAAVQAVSDLWYGLLICSEAAADIEQVAAYIETQEKIYMALTLDTNVLDSAVSSDIASVLKGKAYHRTALLYSTQAVISGPDAGWVGGQLPNTPGANTWKFKTIVGTTPDKFSGSQRTTTIGTSTNPGKNCNIYETVGGVGITEEGFMASGQFIDVTIGVDWIKSTMQTNIFQILVSNPKIPYTDAGVALIENAINQTLKQGVLNGLIADGSISITVPSVDSISVNTRAQRILPDVTWTCRLAGALHFIVINGVVTV